MSATPGAPREFQGTDRFEVRERLGAGATGVVYRAFDRSRSAEVALKLLRRIDALALYRFKSEFRALADVSHPNLVALHELISAGSEWFFTMELVLGSELLGYIRGGADAPSGEDEPTEEALRDTVETLSLATARAGETTRSAALSGRHGGAATGRLGGAKLHIAPPATEPAQIERMRDALRQLAEGVHALHEANHLHRDLKPSNVMVAQTGRVVILDFGLVAELSARGGRVEELRTVGTPAYMAPEQARGAATSEATDWYAAGVMLYEALTGRRPFVGSSAEVLAAKQRTAPRPVLELAFDAPSDLAALCDDLLAREPADRPSGREVLARLGGKKRRSKPTLGQRAAPWAGFVGRDAHLALLDRAFEAVCGGEPRTVFVHGASGVGKSAMVARFVDTARAKGAVVLTGRCFERESVPYKALDDLIDALSRHLLELPRREVWDLMPPDVYALARLFPVLRRVEAILGAARIGLEDLPPHELRRRAFQSLRALLLALARRGPLVLCIDDVQWGDSDSAALLANLMREPGAPPIMLLACYRREDAETSPLLRALLPAQRAATSLAIEPLSPEESRRLALDLLEVRSPAIESLAASIARESRGNPYLVAELVAYVTQAEPRQRASLGSEISYEIVLEQRLLELSVGARRLLELVAVAGRPISQAVALRAAELGPQEQHELAALRSANLVHTRGTRDRDEIECFHERIRETAIARMRPDALVELHARLARVLEASGEADAQALAFHLEAAGRPERALAYLVEAADAAAEALAFDRAATLYGRAVRMGGAGDEALASLNGKLADALYNAGRRAEAAAVYVEASRYASGNQVFEYGRLAAEAYLSTGHIDEGLRVLEQVLAAVDIRVPRSRRASMWSVAWRRAWLRARGLRPRRRDEAAIPPREIERTQALWTASVGFGMVEPIWGADFQTRHLLQALRTGAPRLVARAFAAEAGYRSVFGRAAAEEGLALARRARELGEQSKSPQATAWAYGGEGLVAYQLGQWRQSRERVELAIGALSGKPGFTWEISTLQLYQIWALYYLGELDELCRTVPEVLEEARERGDLYSATNLATGIPNVYWLVRDDLDGARNAAKVAVSRWSTQSLHLQHFWFFLARMHQEIYARDPREAMRVANETWEQLDRSLLVKVSMVRCEGRHARARCALLAAAAAPTDPAPQRVVERDSKAMMREKLPFAEAWAWLQLAGLSAIRGAAEQAVEQLDRAIALCDSSEMSLYAAAARYRRGELVGGDEGTEARDAAIALLRDCGVVSPMRMIHLFAP